MSLRYLAIALLALALALGAAACGEDDDDSAAGGDTTTGETTTSDDDGSEAGKLEGETGPGFEIELRQDGEDVQTVPAGSYTIGVEDQSNMHNFHLLGPGVDEEITAVGFQGEKSVTVTLEPGTYTFQCDPHAGGGMKGTFTVS